MEDYESLDEALANRNKVKVVPNLEHLAAMAIFNTCQRMVPDLEKRIDALPKNIVKRLLLEPLIEAANCNSCKHFRLLLQMIHPEFTSLDTKLIKKKFRNPNVESVIFKKMLQKCPKVCTAKVSAAMWHDVGILPRIENNHIFSLMAFKWPNLRHLVVDVAFIENFGTNGQNNLNITTSVCKYLPNLTHLELTVHYIEMTMEDVDHLSTMQKLEYLRLLVVVFLVKPRIQADLLVHVAGRVPNLKRFALVTKWHNTTSHWFVEDFTRLYPNKKLTIKKLWIYREMEIDWPDNLSVEELHIHGELPMFVKSIVKKLDGPVKKWNMRSVPRDQIYELLEKFGPHITHLTIESTDNLDVCHILSKLSSPESVSIKSYHVVVGIDPIMAFDEVQLPHSLFAKCHRFRVTSLVMRIDGGSVEQPKNLELHKSYIENCRLRLTYVSLRTRDQRKAMLWALNKERLPISLEQVNTVRIKLSENQRDPESEDDVRLLIVMMMKRLLHLQKLDILYKTDGSDEYSFSSRIIAGPLKDKLETLGIVVNDVSTVRSLAYVSDSDNDSEPDRPDDTTKDIYSRGWLFRKYNYGGRL